MKALINKNVVAHFAAWIIYFVLLIWVSSDIYGFEVSLKKSIYTVLIHSGTFYLHYKILLPKFLENRKYFIYIVSIIALLAVVTFIFYNYFQEFKIDIRDIVRKQDVDSMPEELKERMMSRREIVLQDVNLGRRTYYRLFQNTVFVIIVLLISYVLRNNVNNRRREKETADLKNQMLEAESKMLKWQINPHFLFNTLNNIYALSQLKSDKTPESIHRLSDMLRYVIYDCNENRVNLNHEIDYIKSYIELQLLKDDDIEKNVKYSLENANSDLEIAPMLLITLVENSFKHSNIEDVDNGWIDIILNTTKEEVNFRIKNSIPESFHSKDKTKGVGLDNVRRRLELLYHDKYSLETGQKDETYSVNLTILMK